MVFKNKCLLILIFGILSSFSACNNTDEGKETTTPPPSTTTSTFNWSHFNYLYKEINFHNKTVGIIHIYSEYPNYEYAIEPSEGFTCVDDVSRAIVLFSKHLKANPNDEDALDKIKKLTEFVLEMQNENGYFNNFIWNDLSINTTYSTSIAELNWWSFRALWGLESAYTILKTDTDITNRITTAIEKLINNIKIDLPVTSLTTQLINDIETPTWLPFQHASDQAALLIIGLLENYNRTNDSEIQTLINAMAQGIMVMQKGDADKYPYGVFLSWENLWHAWGNSQAYALLKTGQKFNNQSYINSALKEIDNFYPYLLKNGFAEAFWIQKTGEDTYSEIERNTFPQIAYGIRPMVWAASEAYKYSGEAKYATLAKDLESWFAGENIAGTAMYNPSTGICFDGIVSSSEINRNSGAESTIERLLVLSEINTIQ